MTIITEIFLWLTDENERVWSSHLKLRNNFKTHTLQEENPSLLATTSSLVALPKF